MANVPLKCYFCQKEMCFAFRHVLSKSNVWKCTNCPYQVQTEMFDGGTRVVTMELTLKGSIYRIGYRWPSNSTQTICYINLIEYFDEMEKSLLIQKFRFIPDWNPTNIKEKLCTALTFL